MMAFSVPWNIRSITVLHSDRVEVLVPITGEGPTIPETLSERIGSHQLLSEGNKYPSAVLAIPASVTIICLPIPLTGRRSDRGSARYSYGP